MIKYLLSKLPNSIFNYLDQLIKTERLRRFKYLVENYGDCSIYTYAYKNFNIKVRSELEGLYISTWSISDDKGEEIMSEENDFYYSVGEAETAAIEWINSQEV